ncbi:hypothetical protein ACLQ3C_16025 [Gordonia sp. DT30]
MSAPASPVPGGAHRLDTDAAATERPIASGADRSPADGAPAGADDDAAGRGVPVLTVVLFLLGCVLLVLAAANLANLGAWSDRWGVIPVFLVFFVVMSVAGRWFWAGADAILGALMWGKAK